jgi:pimeloyl-ACP methyl ester carboxylesterase
MRPRLMIVMWVASLLAAGCSHAVKPGPLSQVRPDSNMPRAGNVYLLRGFIGVFSSGVDTLSGSLNESGVRSHVYQDDQWPALANRIREAYSTATADAEPLVLIGHSYGADDAIRIARQLEKADIPVDLLVTLDPVTPPPVPGNVRRALNIYQSNGAWDSLPFLRGVPVRTDAGFSGRLENMNIRVDRRDLLEPRTSHFNIEKKGKVQEEVVGNVLMACPPRSTWLASRGNRPIPPHHNLSAATRKADVGGKPPHPLEPDAHEAGHRLGN